MQHLGEFSMLGQGVVKVTKKLSFLSWLHEGWELFAVSHCRALGRFAPNLVQFHAVDLFSPTLGNKPPYYCGLPPLPPLTGQLLAIFPRRLCFIKLLCLCKGCSLSWLPFLQCHAHLPHLLISKVLFTLHRSAQADVSLILSSPLFSQNLVTTSVVGIFTLSLTLVLFWAAL